jgi:hypothetical protein
MALLDSEIYRLKAELGFNVLTVGAEPYIGITSLFDQIIQPYMSAGASTTCSTSVAAADTATLRTLVLASGTGFASGVRVVIDVDDFQEVVTARSVSGTSLTAFLTKEHTGTYPVTVEGGESLVREALNRIRDTKVAMSQSFGVGALKKLDDLEWYNVEGKSEFGILGDNLAFWRDQLAALLGIESMWARRRSAGATLSVY